MDDEREEGEERISIVLGVFGLLFFLVLDLISLIPFVGDVESLISTLGVIIGFVSNVGSSIMATWSIVTVAKFIPGLQEAPLWTFGWIFVWYAENHPSGIAGKTLEVAQTATSIEQGVEAVGSGAKAIGEEAAAAKKGAGKLAEEGVAEAGKAAEEAAVASEAAAGTVENAEGAGNAKGAESGNEGNGNKEDEMVQKNERNPMDVLGENIDMPDFDSEDENEGGDQEMAA